VSSKATIPGCFDRVRFAHRVAFSLTELERCFLASGNAVFVSIGCVSPVVRVVAV